MQEPVVVGAFPEPFLHGYDGATAGRAVRYAPGRRGARRRSEALHAALGRACFETAPTDANVFSQ